jgi:hypothetical protein
VTKIMKQAQSKLRNQMQNKQALSGWAYTHMQLLSFGDHVIEEGMTGAEVGREAGISLASMSDYLYGKHDAIQGRMA